MEGSVLFNVLRERWGVHGGLPLGQGRERLRAGRSALARGCVRMRMRGEGLCPYSEEDLCRGLSAVGFIVREN